MMKSIGLVLALLLIVNSANASLVFTFSEFGSSATLVSATGRVDMTGTSPASSPYDIGWDNIGSVGVDNSYTWLADSDYFSFNSPNISDNNKYYSISNSTLNVSGVDLRYLRLDGTSAPYPFFALAFRSALPQTGIVTASGSALIDFDFDSLPYGVGATVDLKGDGSILFMFVPEPSSMALFCFGLVIVGRERIKDRKSDRLCRGIRLLEGRIKTRG